MELIVLKEVIRWLIAYQKAIFMVKFLFLLGFASGCVVWTLWNRKHQLVRVAQVNFMLVIVLGVIFSSLSILAVLFVHSPGLSQSQADAACGWMMVSICSVG